MHKPRTIHGIDPYAPGGLEALFAHHRATFGDAVMEADGETPPPAAGETPPVGTGSTPSPAGGETPPAATPPAETPPAPQKVEDLPDWAQKIIADARKDAGDERVASKTLAAIQKALNPDAQEGEKPDAEALTRQLTEQTTAARAARVELALYKASEKHGADTDLITAVLAHKGKLTELDPSAQDFTSKLDALVKAEVETNPKLKSARAAGQSGADFTGGTGDMRKADVKPGVSRIAAGFQTTT